MKGIRNKRKRWLSVGITLGLLAIVCLVGQAVAQEPDGGGQLTPAGGSPTETFTYQGHLMDGGTPADGQYDFRIRVYDAESGGTQYGSTLLLPDQEVTDGNFTLYLRPGDPHEIFTGGPRWLLVEVRPSGDNTVPYTSLGRQPIAPTPYAWGLRPGTTLSGTVQYGDFGEAVFNVQARHPWGGGPYAVAIYARSSTNSAVRAESQGVGVHGSSTWTYAIRGEAITGTAGYFTTNEGYGVRAITDGGDHWDHGGYFSAYRGYGVYATSTENMAIRGEAGDVSGLWRPTGPVGVAGIGDRGVYGSGDYMGVYGVSNSNSGYGGYFNNAADNGVALYAQGNGSGRNKAALRVDNWESSGGMAAYLVNDSNYHNAHLRNYGTGGVLYLQNGGTDASGTDGGDFVTAVNNPANDAQFRVLTSGEVRSDVGFYTPAADFAEMLPAVAGLEPGDVLVIGADGKLHRGTEPYQGNVLGVHSTEPGFLGGQPVEGELEGHIPLAVVGVVPVKASAENGPIMPGDLLTTSSTPGHAMKADHFVGGAIIGKALEALDESTGVIQMLVMLQ